MEKYQEPGGTSSGSKTSEGNTDRLLPRCVHRKRKRRSEEKGETKKGETKKPKETGKEELDTLRHIVPSLRLDEGEVDTVDVIERTISYIQELHEKIAQRMAQHQEKVKKVQNLSLQKFIFHASFRLKMEKLLWHFQA